MDESQYASPNAPQGDPTVPRKGWFGRNWLWFVPLVLVIPPVMCVGCCGGIFTISINALRNAEPFQIAMQRIQAEPRITSALGEPIDSNLIGFQGNYNQSMGTGGTADYTFTVSGPKDTAHVHFSARQPGEGWVFDTFDVTLPDGETVSLAD